MTQLSQFLNLGVFDATIEKWEKDISRPTALYWKRIVEFVGFDPKTINPTGEF
jgi:hypothetical protein